jgi:pimeloyl-ACP methyl ester carboxylesterase
MPLASTNGIELEYEVFGDSADPAMLLVMGLGMQLLAWDEDFCKMLAERGFYVIRFDNRDVGLSTKIEDAPVPDLFAVMAGDGSSAGYTIEDMADDAAGLLDHLEIEAAHVVGVSMGGMIAQALAINHPDRVLTLTSIMSTTGDRAVGQPRESAIPALISPAPADRDAYIEYTLNLFKLIGSPAYPMDEDQFRALAAASYDRMHYPIGFMRQLAAIVASPERTQALGSARAPTLVIHGEDDPLIVVSGGEATAKAIPGAKLMKVAGMGHDLPRELWPEFVDAIVENTERVRAGAQA